MNPEKPVYYLVLAICVSMIAGLLLDFLFINRFDALLLSGLSAGGLFLLGLAVTRNEIFSMVLPAAVVLILPLVSLYSLKDTDDSCEVIGRYEETRLHGKGSGTTGFEKIQIQCRDGVFERSIWMSERYDLKVGSTI